MTLLLLAGSGEAKRIAWALTDSGLNVIASLAGATRSPDPLPVPTRIGGFGGEAGFRAYLAEERITAVLDATHPYADRITERTARVCKDLGLPYLYCCRPGWVPEPGDDWTEIAREEDAAAHIPVGATVFLGTGRQTLERFANLEGRRVICRQIDPPTAPFPFEGGEYLIGRPPFPVAREKALFRALGVEWLVVKNAGGVPSRTKLTAAGDLGIPVLMIRRPALPDADVVQTVDAAVAWARGR
ncbi:precorrin-6A/cobalt-precorrin-6A reductase [Cognatiyoonia koreensis]|uniref:Precorrin-6A/cobalt-precorrin-6A reductase n=1 Tax=Cognatiyoonia koreensis TaxID=364200 RepID=A0A1I0PHJ7_9RHOB|nr:cobalt-precorrin-6A reductase [Cognatiyoonia koreensis]SEW13720.1 precorrin-6A/cobalt-precorrin-6A reductase [Cognatiyoonia koreensis]